MSASAAKCAANRLNAQKSTGPRTPEGKAASSRNALTHGLFCQDLLVADEDPQQLQSLQEDVMRRMRPRDAVEAQIAGQYLSCAWRVQRLHRAEQYLYQSHAASTRKQADGITPKPVTAAEAMFLTLQRNGEALEKLMRYEQRFFSTMLRCSRELRALQKEEIEDDVNVQNEATAEKAVVQNEATDTPRDHKPMSGQPLPAVLDLPLTPQAKRMSDAIDKALQQNVGFQRCSAMLRR
jgi:hypothetical protein